MKLTVTRFYFHPILIDGRRWNRVATNFTVSNCFVPRYIYIYMWMEKGSNDGIFFIHACSSLLPIRRDFPPRTDRATGFYTWREYDGNASRCWSVSKENAKSKELGRGGGGYTFVNKRWEHGSRRTDVDGSREEPRYTDLIGKVMTRDFISLFFSSPSRRLKSETTAVTRESTWSRLREQTWKKKKERNPHFTGTPCHNSMRRPFSLTISPGGCENPWKSRSSKGFSIVWEDAWCRLRARICSHRHRYPPF